MNGVCEDCGGPLARMPERVSLHHCRTCQTARVQAAVAAYRQNELMHQTGRLLNRLKVGVPICAMCTNVRYNVTCVRCAPVMRE